jgi:hypothetical protein
MVMTEYLPWLSLALLGAFHGLNPGMGWLFAVALGLQEGSRVAVMRALGPITAGHLASIALVVAGVGLVEHIVAPDLLRFAASVALVAFGLIRLTRFWSHPRWVGTRVSAPQLAAWSFLMATAHGAGLMLVPVVLGLADGGTSAVADSAYAVSHAEHARHLASLVGPGAPPAMVFPLNDLLAVALHTAAMFLMMGGLALLVYERLGLSILRRAWVNLDRVWAGSLIAAGLLTLAF